MCAYANRSGHSQGGEEKIILNYFKGVRDGRFLDVGAWGGLTFSNTRALAVDLGWGGVLIEPSSIPYRDLVKLYSDNERCKCIKALVGNKNCESVMFWETADALSTTDRHHMELWVSKCGVPYHEAYAPMIELGKLLLDEGPFAFVNIDTEGTSANLALSCPDLWVNENIRMLCIEHDGQHELLNHTGQHNGFHRRYYDGNNIILARSERK